MRISVVTIVYNDCTNIEQTILSVLNQTAIKQIEYIVVDGASTDGTSEIIRRYEKRLAKYICEADKGIYNAMNKGLDAANGDYLVFINSGDRLSFDNTIENIIKAIGEDRPDVVYGGYREMKGGRTFEPIPCRHYSKIWYGPVASHQSTYYYLNHLRNHHISYDETYRIAADYKMTAEAIKYSNGNILQLSFPVSDFDISGLSCNNQNLGLKEANRVRREVLGWNRFQNFFMTFVLLAARYFKQNFPSMYKLLRY